MKENRKKPELLLPAGSMEVLRIAEAFGADAVYVGGEAFGLRAKAKNFTTEELAEAVAWMHARGKKLYVTVNIFAHNEDIPGVRAYLSDLREIGPDALIISDPGIFAAARELCPELDIHISTQANNTNYETYRFWQKLGAMRVVSARELSVHEIAEIRAHIPEELEIETFVHGAMCISYSGRCLLSSYFTGRDSNRGECTHPCRWQYAVSEESRPGEYLPVEENERGTFLFNSRDLCMISHLPELVHAGIDSFKIEGRMKTALYVATVARAYRRALDDLFISEEEYRKRLPEYEQELRYCTHRPYGTGFFFGKPDASSQIYEDSTYERGATYLGYIEAITDDGRAVIEQKNKFSVGETIEVLKPDGRNVPVRVTSIRDENGQEMDAAPHPKQRLSVDLGEGLAVFDVLRRREPEVAEEA